MTSGARSTNSAISMASADVLNVIAVRDIGARPDWSVILWGSKVRLASLLLKVARCAPMSLGVSYDQCSLFEQVREVQNFVWFVTNGY